MKSLNRLALIAAGMFFAASAHALLISASFSKNFPFGPFEPDEPIEIIITLANNSADQAFTICEGPCVGDEFTYSLGGLTGIPTGYSFYFGDDPVENFFDGQIAGTLLPGQEKDFVFGIYTPDAVVAPGFYSFYTQLQFFAATAERPMLDTSTFLGRWEVAEVPEPSILALLGFGLLGLMHARRHR